jgi:DNA-binding beta-propeller fold protein YncE
VLGWLVYRSEGHDDDLDSVALTTFVAVFLLVTVTGLSPQNGATRIAITMAGAVRVVSTLQPRGRETMSRKWTVLLAATVAATALGSAGGVEAGTVKLKQIGTISNPAGPIDGFDISFVDQKRQRYYLADRSNKSVDIFDARTDKFIGSVGGFVGVSMKNGKPNNDTSGPDGVVVVGSEVWAGDGDSTIKVIDLTAGKIVDTIKTGGTTRVDEMAYDPKDSVFISVNNAEEPPFATLVSTKPGHKIIAKITFEHATDGAEQPAYNRADGMFYVAIPELKKDAKKGGVAVIDPRAGRLVKIIGVDNCHPNGLVFGPGGNFALGCTADGREMPAIIAIMNAKTGKLVKAIPDIGAADMVAYNPKTGEYYTASPGMPGGAVLGIIDAKANTLVDKVAIKGGDPHSVDVNRSNGHVFVPAGSANGGCGCVMVFAPQ